MKLLFSLSMAFILVNSMAQTESLNLSFNVWPPFSNVEGETSIATNIVSTALDRVNIKSSYVVEDFDVVLEGIYTGVFDGSPSLWKSEEREKHVLFSEPYLENQLILVGRKGANVALSYFSQLQGHKIGLVKDYAYGDSLTAMADLQIVFGKDDQENLVNLLSEKVDYMLVDALLIQYLLKYELNDVSALLEFARTPLIVRPLHFAIRMESPDAENVISLFNDEIQKMIKDGTYNELLGLNWIKVDMNGDGMMEIVFSGEAAGTEEPAYAYEPLTSDAQVSNQYYIGGQYYNSWDEVPDKYKVKIPEDKSGDVTKYDGMTIKF